MKYRVKGRYAYTYKAEDWFNLDEIVDIDPGSTYPMTPIEAALFALDHLFDGEVITSDTSNLVVTPLDESARLPADVEMRRLNPAIAPPLFSL